MKTGSIVGSDRLFSQEAATARSTAVRMGLPLHASFKMTAPELTEWVERRTLLHRLMGHTYPEPILVRAAGPKHAYTGPCVKSAGGKGGRKDA